jgi:hypothetical protein
VIWPTPYRRGTVLVPSGPAHDPDRKHLFIVLTDPCPTGRDVLMVNISTVRSGCDQTCKLFAGDHPFIQRDSFVEYAMARIEAAEKIANGVKTRVLAPHADMDSAIFARVCHGLSVSPFVKPRMLRYYRERTGL